MIMLDQLSRLSADELRAKIAAFTEPANQSEVKEQMHIRYNLGMREILDGKKEQGLAILRLVAEAKYGPAQYLLGALYCEGTRIEINYEEAAKWARRALENNYRPALFTIDAVGDRYIGLAEKETDPSEAQHYCVLAVDCFRNAAQEGFAPAMYHLGSCYLHGWGVNRDPYEGAQWLMRAAEVGYELANGLLRDIAKVYPRAVQIRSISPN